MASPRALRLLLRLASTTLLAACGAPPVSGPLRPAHEERAARPRPTPAGPFAIGYNEAWFGPHYGRDLTTSFDLARVRATFDGIRVSGGRIVRLWLFEGLEGVAQRSAPPRITGVDAALLTNLERVLVEARARELVVYLTALDGNTMPEAPGPLRDLYGDLLNAHGGEADAYEAKVLAPLLQVLGQHRDVIYGFDLVNEIQAPRQRGYFADPVGGPRATLKRTAAFVKRHAPWLPVTASAGHESAAADLALGAFSGLGLDFYDLHAYSDAGTIPGAAAVCARAKADGVPIVLGELGQATRADDDALQATVTDAFLTAAKSTCFTAALPWRFDAAESYWRFVRPDGSPRPAVRVMKRHAP